MVNHQEKKKGLGTFSWILLGISSILIIFSFFAPNILVENSDLFKDKGPIGDTIGGLMNPFIAIAGVIITGLAFYMQYRANQIQIDIFLSQQKADKENTDEQIRINKEQFQAQLDLQINQQKLQQFESQFYEMLRIYDSNVRNISILKYENINDIPRTYGEQIKITTEKVNGKQCFIHLLLELSICYHIIKNSKSYLSERNDKKIKLAYNLFYHGDIINLDYKCLKEIINHRNRHKSDLLLGNSISILKDINFTKNYNREPQHSLFNGHSEHLSTYIRHLYQTVKFVINNNNISYEDQRNYLRILRSQMSNEEQVLLYYNWLAGFGGNWENDTNKFFTDYRMIHNIYQELLFDETNLDDFIDQYPNIKKEKNREKDSLFEFQDWEDEN